MREQVIALDSAGFALDVGAKGYGFRVVPARPRGATGRPGSYPVQVQTDDGRIFEVGSDDGRLLARAFGSLKMLGEAGDVWKVQVFETPTEAVFPPGQRSTCNTTVQAPTSCPTTAPSSSTDGFKVRPGTKAHTFYASGTLTTARLYARSAAGNWYDTGSDLDFAGGAVQTTQVFNSGDRLALVAAAGGMLIEIDAEVECA